MTTPFDENLFNINPTIVRVGNYINRDTKLVVRCVVCNHTWATMPKLLIRKQKSGCPECNRRSKSLTINQINTSLNVRGIIAQGEYISSNHPMQFMCSYGHTWNTTPTQLIHANTGCPYCAGNVQYTKKQIMEELPSHISLVGEYNGMNNQATFKCSHNHSWNATPSNIIHQKHHKCPTCFPYEHNKSFGRRTVIDNIVFRSELEADCYSHLKSTNCVFSMQVKYPHNTRMKCDFYLPNHKVWIEVSSFKNQQYLQRIKSKQWQIENTLHEHFHFASSLSRFIDILSKY